MAKSAVWASPSTVTRDQAGGEYGVHEMREVQSTLKLQLVRKDVVRLLQDRLDSIG